MIGLPKSATQIAIEYVNYVEKHHPEVHAEALGHANGDYCGIGMSSCRCGWVGVYPVSGCPKCHTSFVN